MFINRQTDENDDYAKRSWADILSDRGKHDVAQHIDLITTVWEVVRNQAPDVVERIVLKDCMRHPERYE